VKEKNRWERDRNNNNDGMNPKSQSFIFFDDFYFSNKTQVS